MVQISGFTRRSKSYNRGTEAAGFGWRVRPVEDVFSAREDGAHHLTLHTDAFAVNDPDGPEAFFMRESQVFLDDQFHVPRRNCVQIEHVSDLNLHRLRK